MPDTATGQEKRIRLVLFDLDGTFADTAPDLAYALNQTLIHHGRDPLPYEQIRPHVSHGGIALVKLGFQIDQEHEEFENYRSYLLDVYRDNVSRETSLFPGMENVLDTLESSDLDWGIVTNKPAWLTDPLMQDLGLDSRASCIVSGDTTTNRKPHPEPILHACKLAGHRTDECLYIGDAERDIEAGRNAGTATLTALFGYIGENDRPEQWGADGDVDRPEGILDWLGLASH